MTASDFSLTTVPEDGPDQHHRSFKGVPRILGPKWAQLPVITIGMLGVSTLWSVEKSYGLCRANMLNNFFFLMACQLHLLTFPRTIQVKHGWCLRCRTAFWTYRATANRHVMHTISLFIKTKSPDQLLLGVMADNCTSRFGRRRPYMLLGTVVCVLGTLLLGFTRPVASIFTTLGSHSVGLVAQARSSSKKILTYNCLEQRRYSVARYFFHIFN